MKTYEDMRKSNCKENKEMFIQTVKQFAYGNCVYPCGFNTPVAIKNIDLTTNLYTLVQREYVPNEYDCEDCKEGCNCYLTRYHDYLLSVNDIEFIFEDVDNIFKFVEIAKMISECKITKEDYDNLKCLVLNTRTMCWVVN